MNKIIAIIVSLLLIGSTILAFVTKNSYNYEILNAAKSSEAFLLYINEFDPYETKEIAETYENILLSSDIIIKAEVVGETK